MNTCKTCKHWKKAGPWETGYGLGLGTCGKFPMYWDATEWSEEDEEGGVGITRKLNDKYKDNKAFLQDGSDYSADLLTKESFGCVEHEE